MREGAAAPGAAVPFADADLFREVGVISRRNEELSAPARAFLNLLSVLSSSPQEIGDTGLRPLSARPFD